MTSTLRRLHVSPAVDSIVATLEEHGAVLVEGLLDGSTVDRLNAELDPAVQGARPDRSYLNPALDCFYGTRTRNVTGLVAKSRAFGTEVLCHPTLLGVCDAMLLPACARYQLNVAQVLDRGPGADAQLLHRDEAVWAHMPRPHPELQLASVIAEVVRDLPRQAQELLGWAAHDAIDIGGGYLGAVDLSDPVQLLADGQL